MYVEHFNLFLLTPGVQPRCLGLRFFFPICKATLRTKPMVSTMHFFAIFPWILPLMPSLGKSGFSSKLVNCEMTDNCEKNAVLAVGALCVVSGERLI